LLDIVNEFALKGGANVELAVKAPNAGLALIFISGDEV
jgi:hypothetical protein